MKAIEIKSIIEEVKKMCMTANYNLNDDVIDAIKSSIKIEESPAGKEILNILLENAEVAEKEKIAICQDTGFAVFFVELGDGVSIDGGNLIDAINEGVKLGYEEGYLRKSICHPFTRANTNDNTPAIVHVELVPGDELKITMAPKGGGSENMSRIKMLKPSDGKEGVIDFALQCVNESGGNPCPPLVVGIGIGGTMEKAAILSKKSLIRPIGQLNSDGEVAELEREILTGINDLGIGPQGLGGRVTAFAVNIEMHPCHIASLPVAVNLNCHASRHKMIVI
ncbi:fumarate hydratase [Spirochaetota bacterium]